ncbi:MAG: hypothetical protein AAB592_01540, partial [Patescibacteria group bacterium]
MTKLIFNEFTGKYSLSKTLRFSLIPVLTKQQENKIKDDKEYENDEQIRRQDRIEKFFTHNKQNIFGVDIERKKRYKALKYYLTELHKLFIKSALEKVKTDNAIDFTELFKSYKSFESCKDDEQKDGYVENINVEKIRIAKFFGNNKGKGGVFLEIAKTYHGYLESRLKTYQKGNKEEKEKIKGGDDEKKGFANGTKNILLSQNVLRILEEKIKDKSIQERIENDKNGENKYKLSNIKYCKNGEEKEGMLTDYFEGWSTYFKNFNEIRGNLYKDDGRKEESEGSEGEVKIKKANAGQLTTRILDENFEIFVRNAVWAEKNKENLKTQDFQGKDIMEKVSIGVFDPKFYIHCLLQADINTYNAKIAELNKFFNENKVKDKEIKYLKPLFKQLLLSDKPEGEEDIYIQEFVDDEDFINGLDEFYKHSKEKFDIVKSFLSDGGIKDNFDDIYLNENQLRFFCNKYFGSWSYLRDLYYRQNKIADEGKSKKEDDFRDTDGVTKIDISLEEIKTLLDGETKQDFIDAVKRGWFCFDFESRKGDLFSLVSAGVFKEDVDNFQNFIAFLKFDINSLLNGRELLSRKEVEDKNKISEIKASLDKSREEGERVDELLLEKFSKENFTQNLAESIETKQESFEQAFQQLKESIKNKKKLARDEDFECKKAINEYCSRVSDLNGFFALFSVPEGVVSDQINSTVNKYKENNKIVPLFNAIRNFITKRADELEKIKLNFDTQTLLGGWAYKTTDYKCRILKKEANYYLLIIGRPSDENSPIHNTLNEYEIMDYYQQKGQTIFGSVYKGKFGNDYNEDRSNPDNAILIRNIEQIIDENLVLDFPKTEVQLNHIKAMIGQGKFSFGIDANKFNEHFLKKTDGISFSEYRNKKTIQAKEDIVIQILKEVFGNDKFDYRQDRDYLLNRIKEMMKKNVTKTSFLGSDRLVYEITKLEPFFYKNSFRQMDLQKEDNILQDKELFPFQIYCKDFSPTKDAKSTKNLHTLFFEGLFSKENEENPIFKLSGGAEVFFRGKIDDYKIDQWERKDLRNPKTNKLPNKKRRFTENQIFFHVSVVLNNISDGGNINHKIQEYIQRNEDVKILGIDRGEKELAYYCLLDSEGKICGNPTSMNEVGSNILIDKSGKENEQSINYRQKLDIKEKERMMARRSWTKIEGIKDLKSGYISNVVNDIARLMVNNNAMVCLEELNHGFKRDRSIRIEKGVYQRLENALVDKLNYLVLTKTPNGVRNALQLTPENRAIKYWGNQMGAILYTDAKFTSKTCPHCGFRRRGVESMKTAKQVKEKIKKGELKIFYEKAKDRFRIEYSWKIEAFEFGCEELYGKDVMEIIYS